MGTNTRAKERSEAAARKHDRDRREMHANNEFFKKQQGGGGKAGGGCLILVVLFPLAVFFFMRVSHLIQ